jgi:hypothetical protein
LASFQSIQKEIFPQEEINLTRNPFLSLDNLENLFVVEPDSIPILGDWRPLPPAPGKGLNFETGNQGPRDRPKNRGWGYFMYFVSTGFFS